MVTEEDDHFIDSLLCVQEDVTDHLLQCDDFGDVEDWGVGGGGVDHVLGEEDYGVGH